jgi:PIN domain nuclease of toxin-antitoxin system
LLFDTHAFLWWAADDPRLSRRAREALADPANEVFLSGVNAWEAAILAFLGRVSLGAPVADLVARTLSETDVEPLPIELGHAARLEHLPFHHRDPFDRMLVAQAQAEGLTVLTRDPAFARYGVPVLW